MNEKPSPSPRHAPASELPPYSYVPGHDLPHPVNDPAGHLYAAEEAPREHELPISASTLASNPRWLYATDLFNAGFYWEGHEVWEGFWHAFGRTSPEAKFIQGLIHLAAACVKIRQGKPAGVARHTKRARELLGDLDATHPGGPFGITAASMLAVVNELEGYIPACWHTSKTPVVRVLAENLRLAD